MVVGPERELDLCEECGAPLQDGFCFNCGDGFREGASPVGAAPLDRSDLSKVLRRPVGPRAHGSYALSMQQDEKMAPLRKQIELLVEQFNASPQTKNSVKQISERNAVKLLPDLGPTKAAVASVAQEFLSLGRTMAEASFYVARIHPRVGRLSSLVLEVYAPSAGGEVEVLVSSRKREFKSCADDPYKKLRIPVYCWDDAAVVELRNAFLCEDGYPAKRVKVLAPSRFALTLPERTFQLFKILKEAKLSGLIPAGGLSVDPVSVARKYSVARLPFTERFLRETGYLNRVNARYTALLRQKLANGNGRMPRKLAEEALTEACHAEVPQFVSDQVVKRYRLKPSEMSSLIVLSEFDAWQRMDG